MKVSQKELINLYQNLGKLFFAISAVDKSVRQEEFSKLKNLVRNEWSINNNFLDTDKSSIIIATFDWLHNDQEYDAQDCFNSFVDFKNRNQHLFTKQVIRLIMKTANEIASSFNKKTNQN